MDSQKELAKAVATQFDILSSVLHICAENLRAISEPSEPSVPAWVSTFSSAMDETLSQLRSGTTDSTVPDEAEEKDDGKKKKRKRKGPKKLSAYTEFLSESLKGSHGSAPARMAEAAQQWKTMSEEEKQPYKLRAIQKNKELKEAFDVSREAGEGNEGEEEERRTKKQRRDSVTSVTTLGSEFMNSPSDQDQDDDDEDVAKEMNEEIQRLSQAKGAKKSKDRQVSYVANSDSSPSSSNDDDDDEEKEQKSTKKSKGSKKKGKKDRDEEEEESPILATPTLNASGGRKASEKELGPVLSSSKKKKRKVKTSTKNA
jgi:hypothetical protein